ncbi:hypothetical protein G9464_20030 [Halostella sp. JP-L12]|uniref:hypothetical protein n=1 Tax=Halostella TaxID=1843185 RepID=UPI000EF7E858|nr:MULTISPECIES: hypothetical protein [Halostella]NHN49861.1 hypothetical protein [Halostella sp. JP-L12]
MSIRQRTLHFTTNPRNLVAIVGLLGLIGLGLAFFLPNAYTLTIPPLLLAGAVGSLAVRKHEYDVEWPALPNEAALFGYLMLILATLVLYLTSGYARTLPVHVLTLTTYAVVVFLVFYLDSMALPLAMLLSTGIVHRALIYYSSAAPIGLDGLFHLRMAEEIAATGSMAPLVAAESKYWFSPLYHVQTAAASGVLGVTPRDAAFLTTAIFAVAVPTLVTYAVIAQLWTPRVGVLSGFVYIVADSAVAQSVHLTPTTLGIVLFSLLLLSAVKYLETGGTAYLVLFVLGLVGQVLNHQLSMFITFFSIGTFLVAATTWSGEFDSRSAVLIGLLSVSSVIQWFGTRMEGPGGETTFAEVIVTNLYLMITSGGERGAVFPETGNFTLSGANSLTPIHIIGIAILFALGIVGAVYWLDRTELSDPSHRFAVGLGSLVAAMSFIVFGGPIFGLDLFLPTRWVGFMYVVLAMFGGLGVYVIASDLTVRTGHLLTAGVVVLLLLTPYSAFMLWNYPGSLDGPVFDDANGAQRLSTTDTERNMYVFADRNADETTVIADRVARQVIERYYEHPAAPYITDYGSEEEVQYQGDVLIADRQYSHSNHASYQIRHQGSTATVFGPMPIEWERHSKVYSNGDDNLRYVPGDPTLDEDDES